MVEISQETFDRIMEKKMMLDCLLAVGVQYWDGYEAARRMYDDMQASRPTMEQCRQAQERLQAQVQR